MQFSQTPTYNLKAVINETGIKAATLRIWERRYGLPAPARSPGRQRLYSRFDIEVIRWLLTRQAEGSRISQAVEQYYSLLANGQNPFIQTSLEPSSDFQAPSSSAFSHLDALREQWLSACKAFDETTAEKLLNQSFALYSVELVCSQILQAGLRQMGETWYMSQVSVQQEHFTSALAVRRLEALLTATPQAVRHSTIMLGCAPDELHTFSPLFFCLLLRRRGWNVVYLGANLPDNQMSETVRQINPDLVVLTAQTLVRAANMLPVVENLYRENVPVAYGGWVFTHLPELRKRFPAIYLGDELTLATNIVEDFYSTPYALPPALLNEKDLKPAITAFRQQRAIIENNVIANHSLNQINLRYLQIANYYLGNDLLAALELGDITFLELDLQWIKNMLSREAVSQEMLKRYFRIYIQALQQNLGDEGKIITDWDGWSSLD